MAATSASSMLGSIKRKISKYRKHNMRCAASARSNNQKRWRVSMAQALNRRMENHVGMRIIKKTANDISSKQNGGSAE